MDGNSSIGFSIVSVDHLDFIQSSLTRKTVANYSLAGMGPQCKLYYPNNGNVLHGKHTISSDLLLTSIQKTHTQK